MKNPELLHTASEQFLGKKEHEIKSTVLQTLEGHLRFLNIYWKQMTELGVPGDLKWKSRELMVEEAVHNSNLQGHPWNADSRGGVQRQRPVCFISQRGCCSRCWEVTISDVHNSQQIWKSSPTRLLPRCDMCIVQLLKCNKNISILAQLQYGPTSVHMNNLVSWRVDIVPFYVSAFSYFNHC